MQPSPHSDQVLLPSSAESPQSLKREDLAYQAMTVAAILLVLTSLWVF
jgi:hypothetical protein